MPTLNVDVPHFFCRLRREFCYDLKSHKGEFDPCAVFMATSIPPRALMFTCMLDNGAQIARLPISAFVHSDTTEDLSLDQLQLWGCFSYDVTVIECGYLKDLRCAVLLKDRTWRDGRYMMTFDWYGTPYADEPGEGGFKTAHLIALDNGQFALQPNNRMKWFEPSFITKPFDTPPDYLTNSHVWHCETKHKWSMPDDDKYFY
jgi:hypothetical protein